MPILSVKSSLRVFLMDRYDRGPTGMVSHGPEAANPRKQQRQGGIKSRIALAHVCVWFGGKKNGVWWVARLSRTPVRFSLHRDTKSGKTVHEVKTERKTHRLGEVLGGAQVDGVHLPVSGDERNTRHHLACCC